MMPEIKPHNDREVRTFPLQFTIECREDGSGQKIEGHAAVFNKIDGPPWFRERIAPGAFAESIVNDDIRALFNHDPNHVLGRNKAGTLELQEDDAGLWMRIYPPDTTIGRDLMRSIARGDISQASFAFQTIDDDVDTVDGEKVRTLKKVRLFDVSPVTFPFYEATDVALRKEEWDRELEKVQARKGANRNNIRRKRLALKHNG